MFIFKYYTMICVVLNIPVCILQVFKTIFLKKISLLSVQMFLFLGPNKWSSIAPICGHSAQSPINIKTHYLYPNPDLGLLHLGNYSKSLYGSTVLNNGHTGKSKQFVKNSSQ